MMVTPVWALVVLFALGAASLLIAIIPKSFLTSLLMLTLDLFHRH
jgi:hypothetical protein